MEHKTKGNSFFAANDFQQAIACYTQAIEVNPQDHTLYSNRSAAYLKVQEFQKALEDAKTCLGIKSDFAKGLIRLGDAQTSLLQYEDATQTYISCIATKDESVAKFAESGLQNAKIKGFYAPLLDTMNGVEVRYINEKKGKGIFATKDYKKGDLIFQEGACIISLDPECNKSHVCDHCMCFVEPISSQISRSQLKLSANELALADKCNVPNPVICAQCNTRYCSDSCYSTAMKLYHSKLCVSPSSQEHPLNKYRSLPMVKEGPTSTTFSLAERVFAVIATTLGIEQSKLSKLDINSLFGPLRYVQRTSLMKLQPVYDGSNLAQLQTHLSEPLRLIREALFADIDPLFTHSYITEQLFDEVLGMISQNNTTAYVLPTFFHQLSQRHEKDVAHIRAHGMCLFLVHSCINHSCSPSILSALMHKEDHVRSAKVVIRAIKPIKKGEELLFTYIDETQSTSARKAELLAKYGFTCNCPKCE